MSENGGNIQRKVLEIQNDNDFMWQEILRLNEVLPPNSIKGVAVMERQSYLTDSHSNHASGRHTPSKNLMNMKIYKGPEIKPLVPKHVAA